MEAAELAVELEDLLHHVWRCERSWHLDDRLDAAARAAAGKQGL